VLERREEERRGGLLSTKPALLYSVVKEIKEKGVALIAQLEERSKSRYFASRKLSITLAEIEAWKGQREEYLNRVWVTFTI
jgi:hypothetical protein